MIFDILGMENTRFMQVYIVQGIVGAIFIYIAYLILKRDKKRLNVIFAFFYLIGAAGVLLNFVYAPLTDEFAVLILNFFTNYLLALAAIFLVIFDLILLKSEKIITTKKQLMILGTYGGALLGMLVFLALPEPGVIINAATDWKPVYTLPYYIYFMAVLIIGAVIPSFFYSFRIYSKFEDEQLRKKWRFFLVGLIIIMIFMVGTFTMNYLNNEALRKSWSLISLIFIATGPVLIYYGVGKQIEK